MVMPGTKLKDQPMKICTLALASLFASQLVHATTLTENFSTNPLQHGWQIWGNADLFRWDANQPNLDVTWDSTQPNSYFYHPLGTVLTTNDDFSLAFDLQLADATASGFFELAVGFLNIRSATNANFARGTGTDSPNLAEFNFFPDTGWGPTLSATVTDTNSTFNFLEDFSGLDNGVTYHIALQHAAGAATVSAQVFSGGKLYSTLPVPFLSTNFLDFRLDTIAVSSYTATNDPWGDALLAHGTVANLSVTLPPPPVQNLSGQFLSGQWQVQFLSRTHWQYALERSTNLRQWTTVAEGIAGNDTNAIAADPAPLAGNCFYRVRADRP